MRLEQFTEQGAPKNRVITASDARDIWMDMYRADLASSMNRSQLDDMFDGVPPWDESILKNLGQSDRCNLNFGTSNAIFESAFAGYLDLIESVPMLARVKLKRIAGTDEQRHNWEQIIGEEFHYLITREWSSFDRHFQILAMMFIKHGVCLSLFLDKLDWRWTPIGLGDAKLPRKCRIDEEQTEVVCIKRVYQPQELYKHILDEEAAVAAGWNVPAVKDALINCIETNQTTRFDNWEELQKEYKDNDLYSAFARGTEIPILHMFVKEFDRSVTFSMLTEKPLYNGDDFLCRKTGFYESMDQAFLYFTYGPGNGYIHSVRGLGWKVFPHVQVENRLRCQIVDGAMLSSTLLLQIADPKDLEELGFTYYGPYSVINKGATVVERAIPNIGQAAMPVVNDLLHQMESNTGTYRLRGGASEANGQERTKFEVAATLQSQAHLSQSAMALFYNPWRRLLREQLRRLCRRDLKQSDSGGDLAFAFRQRCVARGIPAEALYQIEDVDAVRAVGYGSPGARLNAVDALSQMIPTLDEVGRANAIRDKIAALVGYQNVDRYLPSAQMTQRIPVDAKIAQIENGDMAQGHPVQVLPGENHALHANEHALDISQKMALIQQGQDPRPYLNGLNTAMGHLQQHVGVLSQDPSRAELSGKLREFVQQNGAVLEQINQHVAAQARREQEASARAAEQAQGAAPVGGMQIDPELNMRMQKAQSELALKTNEARTRMKTQAAQAVLDMQIKAEQARQKLAAEDAKLAAQLSRKKVSKGAA